MLELDHIAVSGETLEDARSFVEESLGVPMVAGGRHAVFHTHNTLLGLDGGLYLEAIAIDPDAPAPDRPRWFDLDRFKGRPRVTNWICRVAQLSDILPEIPLDFGDPVDLERGDLRWQMAVPADGILPFDNCAPALIQWKTDVHPASLLTSQGVRLRKLTVYHPQAGVLSDYLRPHLSDPRIDFETGSPGYDAEFSTPHGERAMSW